MFTPKKCKKSQDVDFSLYQNNYMRCSFLLTLVYTHVLKSNCDFTLIYLTLPEILNNLEGQ